MEPRETQEVNEASGNSIFWALIALALNAMTDLSRLGCLFRPQSGPGTSTNSDPGFDPLRSSPVLCAAEIVLDIFFFIVDPKPQETISSINATPNAPNTTEHRPPVGRQNPDVLAGPAPATTHVSTPRTDNSASSRSTLKAVAFFLGVLPQAIKLFSMSGIVGTQICAAMFLAASVARAISYKSQSHFAASIDVLKNLDIYTVPRLLLLLSTYIAHIVVYIWLYFNIAAAAVSDRSANILFTLATLARMSYMLFVILTLFFNLAWRRSLPLSKCIPMIACLFIQSLDTSTPRYTESGTLTGSSPAWFKSYSLAVHLIALTFIGSPLISALCIASGRVLARLAAKRAARHGEHSDSSLPTTSTNANHPESMDRFTDAIETLRKGMGWLQAMVVGLFKAFDNHGEWLGTWHKGFGMSSEQFVLACGIFNLLSVVLYYLVVFDSTGTASPSWTSVLG